jgi:hypothetical protein
MPTPVMAQPMRIAKGPALTAMFCGKLKTPAPIIEPTTMAVKSPRPSFAVGRRLIGIETVVGLSKADMIIPPWSGHLRTMSNRSRPNGVNLARIGGREIASDQSCFGNPDLTWRRRLYEIVLTQNKLDVTNSNYEWETF